MTVGALKKLIEPFEDALPIIVTGPCLDEDGDECEVWFSIHDVARKMDSDTADEYVSFTCSRLDDFQP